MLCKTGHHNICEKRRKHTSKIAHLLSQKGEIFLTVNVFTAHFKVHLSFTLETSEIKQFESQWFQRVYYYIIITIKTLL